MNDHRDTHHNCPMCNHPLPSPMRVRVLETDVKWFPNKLTKIGVWEKGGNFIMEFFDCGHGKKMWWMDKGSGDGVKKKSVTIFSKLNK